jgi:hypothetical protein
LGLLVCTTCECRGYVHHLRAARNHSRPAGQDLAASKSGSFCGLFIFGDPYNSRRECLINALERLIAWHEKENDQRTAPILKEAKNMLDELMGRKPVQLSLFG